MGVSNTLVTERWAAQITRPANEPEHRSMSGFSVHADQNTIYSYGTHFPMAEIMRDEHGQTDFVLVNGDRFSVTTNGHQSQTRSAIQQTGARMLIIPFTALTAAHIADHGTIRPLEIADDTWTVTYRRETIGEIRQRATQHGTYSNVRPARIFDAIGRPPEYPTPPGYPSEPAARTEYETALAAYETARAEYAKRYAERVAAATDFETADERLRRPTGARTGWKPLERDSDHYQMPIYRHWLGESIFTATVSEIRRRPATVAQIDAYKTADDWYKRRENLATAIRLAEPRYLPASPAQNATMAAARDAYAKHVANRPPEYPAGVSRRRHRDHDEYVTERLTKRSARFLSAFDHNEAREIYFLAELPATSQAETVAQAFDDLAPAIVKRALAAEIDVKRQGDIFAIPCNLPAEITRPAPFKRNHLGAQMASHTFSGYWQTIGRNGKGDMRDANRLLGTDHTATEVLLPQTGETYARGIMRHEPSGRDADHTRIKLDGWHLIVRNTVPRAR